MYDFIGDIHGYGDELEALLIKLGYSKNDGVFQHPTRKAFFLGDFIDRGPKIRKTLEVVKAMVDSGNAKSVIANHEFNLICLLNQDKSGGFLRAKTESNLKQVAATFDQLTEDEIHEYAQWFMELPLWHEEDGFRVVHACWDKKHIKNLESIFGGNKLSLGILKDQFHKGSPLYDSIEVVLKGPEFKLNGYTFLDAQKKERDHARIAWWDEELLVANKELQGKVKREEIDYSFYPKDEKLVFFGHYWLPNKPPYVCSPSAQCLDFSIAKEGSLVAYRHQGEKEINPNNFVWVNSKEVKR